MLRDYQHSISDHAASILQEHGLVYLSMQVRTGKTLTALATADKVGAKLVLFVTKLKAISSIDSDYDAFKPSFQMMVCNYESLHKVEPGFDTVIIDEAHSLGAFPKPSQRAEELRRIIQPDTKVIYLSGTPTPESWSQIYHQLWVSRKGPFTSYANFYKWAKDFTYPAKKYVYSREIADYSKAKVADIDEATGYLFLSYTQEEAGFEEDVQEEVIDVQMSPATYYLANKLVANNIHTGKDGEVVLADTAVKLMNKLHQVYTGTVICDEPERLVKTFDPSKVLAIKERFAGKKIAIFYKFIGERELIRWHIGRDVTSDVQQFAEADHNMVFISQIQSGREGINLSTADALIFLNIDFSAVSYWQARARLQSKDRQKPCVVYWVFAKDGIEQKIYQAVQKKKDYTLQHFKKDFHVRVENTGANNQRA